MLRSGNAAGIKPGSGQTLIAVSVLAFFRFSAIPAGRPGGSGGHRRRMSRAGEITGDRERKSSRRALT